MAVFALFQVVVSTWKHKDSTGARAGYGAGTIMHKDFYRITEAILRYRK
jgi:hypothetical protein